MTTQHERNGAGLLSKQASAEILRAIFPNYPELTPCHPAPEWIQKENTNERH